MLRSSRQVEALRKQLNDLERSLEEVKSTLGPQQQTQAVPGCIDEAKIRRLIRVRRLRERQLDRELFADSAWDILLEAFASELGQSHVSVSGLCDTSGVPATTALRWIKKLEQDGWLIRIADPFDGRRQWLKLAPEASARIRSYFEGVWPTLFRV